MPSHTPNISITKIEFQNLRGYTVAQLSLDRKFTAIIGDNNQGKSSSLLLLDFILNKAEDYLLSSWRPLTDQERELLLPANSTKHQARRLTLYLKFKDLRRERRYLNGGKRPTRLRFSIHTTNGMAQLNLGAPERGERPDSLGLELLKRVRENVSFCMIPATRDVSSEWFHELMQQRLHGLLKSRLIHMQQGGAPTPCRRAKAIITESRDLAEQLSTNVWSELKSLVPANLVKDGSITYDLTREDLIKWLSLHARLKLTTGPHDTNFVPMTHVGTGLQSCLGIAMGMISNQLYKGVQTILGVEEPEAFLHPSAQRSIASTLRSFAAKPNHSVIITSHSPIMLEEAKYGETVIARGRKYYEPLRTDAKREAINTAFMNVANAETFFASRVVFVEGPGDKAILETLLRRLRLLPNTDWLWGIHVQITGSQEQFIPWVKLLRSYGDTHDRPIRWFSILDSDAASGTNGTGAIMTAIRDIGYNSVKASIHANITALGNRPWDDIAGRVMDAKKANHSLWKLRFGLFSVDLEWAMLNSMGNPEQTLQIINDVFTENGHGKQLSLTDAAKKLGSKVNTGTKVHTPLKAPHLRAEFARRISFASLPEELEAMLIGCLKRLAPKKGIVNDLIATAKVANPKLT